MVDKFLAFFALVILAAFVGIIIVFVPELDLAIVTVITVVMAGYDFYRSTFRQNGGNHEQR